MENLRSEIAYQEIQKSLPEKEGSDTELKEKMTPKNFLGRLSSILTSVETAFHRFDHEENNQGDDKQIEKRAKSAKDKFFKRIRPYLFTIMMAFAYSPHLDNPAYEDIASAQMQMKRNGITDDQRKAYIPGVSELVYRGVEPYSYEIDWALENFIPNALHGRDDYKNAYLNNLHFTNLQINSREDAWRMYLGLPQKNDTFGISHYRPAKSKEDKYYYKLNHFLEGYMLGKGFQNTKNIKKESIKFILEHIEQIKGLPGGAYDGDANTVMGVYKLDKGKDVEGYYISYCDKWDLDFEDISKIGAMTTSVIGKSFEIYDRIYYNPDTLEIIEPQTEPEETK